MPIAHTAMTALTRDFRTAGGRSRRLEAVVAVISRESRRYSSTVHATINIFSTVLGISFWLHLSGYLETTAKAVNDLVANGPAHVRWATGRCRGILRAVMLFGRSRVVSGASKDRSGILSELPLRRQRSSPESL